MIPWSIIFKVFIFIKLWSFISTIHLNDLVSWRRGSSKLVDNLMMLFQINNLQFSLCSSIRRRDLENLSILQVISSCKSFFKGAFYLIFKDTFTPRNCSKIWSCSISLSSRTLGAQEPVLAVLGRNESQCWSHVVSNLRFVFLEPFCTLFDFVWA